MQIRRTCGPGNRLPPERRRAVPGGSGAAVRIRPVREQDIRQFFQWQEEEPHWERYTCRPIQLLHDYQVFFTRYLQEIESGRQVVFCVEEDGTVVGRMMAFDFNQRNASMEIGYYLCAQARHRDIGRRALAQWVEALFRWPHRELHKLYATTSAENFGSARILERCGFQQDGRLREHYLLDGRWVDQLYFSLLRTEWLSAGGA